MMFTYSQLTMPGLCAGCGAPVFCDDPYKIQSTSKSWWHTYCHDREALASTPDPVNLFVWAVFVPFTVIGWLTCLALLWLAFIN